ncbi:MAG: DUF4124 domain-containing protein [Halomonas subglaciescola]|nr:DUF4124 domain-containing protein [Halomonas subglaciescola]
MDAMQKRLAPWLCGLVLGGLACPTLSADTVYQTTDSQGRVTFTDSPDSGGTALTLKPLTRAMPKVAVAPKAATARQAPGAPFMPYDRFTVAPLEGANALPPEPFSVDINVTPALRDDHKIRLLVDGNISQSAMHGQAFWLPELAAGEHKLQAELLDHSGRVRHRTPSLSVRVAAAE